MKVVEGMRNLRCESFLLAGCLLCATVPWINVKITLSLYIHTYIHIYIYIYRERERERVIKSRWQSTNVKFTIMMIMGDWEQVCTI